MKIILIFIISLIFVIAYVSITLKQVKKEYKNNIDKYKASKLMIIGLSLIFISLILDVVAKSI